MDTIPCNFGYYRYGPVLASPYLKIKEYGKGNSVGLRLLSIDLAIGHLKSFLVYLANINEKRTKGMSNQMSEKESMSHKHE